MEINGRGPGGLKGDWEGSQWELGGMAWLTGGTGVTGGDWLGTVGVTEGGLG